jgi:phytol kinase
VDQRRSKKALLDSLSHTLNISVIWLQIAIVAAWVSLVALVAVGASQGKADTEIVRKIVHIGTGNVILLAWWLQMPAWLGIGASILFSIVTLLSYQFPIIPGIDSVGRKSLGTFFYAVSIGVLIVMFWQESPQYAAIGILVMTWGDGLAALIGQRWGTHRYKIGGIQKSWEGSLTMGIVSFAVSSLILVAVQGSSWQTWIVSIAIALVATVLEAFSRLGIDNLTVPLGSAIVGFLLNSIG